MDIETWQKTVNQWIVTHGVRYFDIKTNALLLGEEVGELHRLIARRYGEQSFKKETTTEMADAKIQEEIGDVLFVLTCMANQLDLDMKTIMEDNINKKTKRDGQRHKYLKNK